MVVEAKMEMKEQSGVENWEGRRTQCPNPGSLEFLASGTSTYWEMPEVCVLRRAMERNDVE